MELINTLNPKLQVWVLNQIEVDTVELRKLLYLLPNRTGKDQGEIIVTPSVKEVMEEFMQNTSILKQINWVIKDSHDVIH